MNYTDRQLIDLALHTMGQEAGYRQPEVRQAAWNALQGIGSFEDIRETEWVAIRRLLGKARQPGSRGQPYVSQLEDIMEDLQTYTRSNPTQKKMRWQDAKEIRKITGLPLKRTIIIAKRLRQQRVYDLLEDKRFIVKYERRCMDPQCNCKDYRLILGPRGIIQIPVWGGGWEPYDGWKDYSREDLDLQD